MKTRKLGDFNVSEIGLGCMNLSHAYGMPPGPEEGRRLLMEAFDLGITHFDTAALYGFGRNEELVGPALKPIRDNILLASKCGMQGVDGVRVIDGRPATIRKTLEDSLRRLQTEVIDLYYLHRRDRDVPIEDSVGEMSRFIEEGKTRGIGLSEVSADTLRRAHATHPVTAVQTEYSLWTRNAEIAVLDACGELGIDFVAFSPVARGFLTGTDLDPATFADKDIRRGMPRFQEPHFPKNAELLKGFRALAEEAGCSPAQLALGWVLSRRPFIHAIPGTTSLSHLRDDAAASGISLSADTLRRAGELINQNTVSGPRYPAATQKEIDTEEFAA